MKTRCVYMAVGADDRQSFDGITQEECHAIVDAIQDDEVNNSAFMITFHMDNHESVASEVYDHVNQALSKFMESVPEGHLINWIESEDGSNFKVVDIIPFDPDTKMPLIAPLSEYVPRIITAAVESSNLNSVSFLEDETAVIVNFKNGTSYKYLDATKDQFEALIKAESVGKHFNSVFKPEHPEFDKIIIVEQDDTAGGVNTVPSDLPESEEASPSNN